MNSTRLLFAFSVGMAAAINPCGFALLPAYLSYYLGLESGQTRSDADTATVADTESNPALAAVWVKLGSRNSRALGWDALLVKLHLRKAPRLTLVKGPGDKWVN